MLKGSSYFLHSSHTIFDGHSERTGAPLLFGRKTSFSDHSFSLEKHLTPRFSAPDLCGPSTLPSLLMRLFGSRNEANDILSRVLPQIFQSHRSPGVPQILGTRIVTHIPILLCHRADLRSAWERSLLSARFCNHHFRPLLIPNFQPEVVGFSSGNSSRLNLGSQGGAFFLFQQVSLPVF